MIPLPTQITALYLILSLAIAIFAFLLAIIAKKSTTLDKLQEDFSKRELQLDQKLYETSVIKSKLETLVNSMTEGVFMMNKDLEMLVINPACKDMLGLTGEDHINIFDITKSFEGKLAVEEKIAQVFKKKELLKIPEVEVGERVLKITIIPVEVAKDVPGVGVLIYNKTEEHMLEEKHEEFMAMIVHELRSPLTVIKNMAILLNKNFDRLDSDKKTEIFSRMRSNSEKLLTIVNTLLDDTKMDLSEIEIEKTRSDLNGLLIEEIGSYASLAEEKHLELKTGLDESIKSFAFDPEKITQVLNNLLSNALKFTEEGWVKVKSEQKDDKVIVSVIDTGVGISDEDKPKLFHKFVQLDNKKDTDKPSTGLGLAISKGIVESHGGEIWIEDNKPSGSKFIFTLPA